MVVMYYEATFRGFSIVLWAEHFNAAFATAHEAAPKGALFENLSISRKVPR